MTSSPAINEVLHLPEGWGPSEPSRAPDAEPFARTVVGPYVFGGGDCVRIWRQDENGPPGEFHTVRDLYGYPSDVRPGHFGLAIKVHRRPPREWPPLHAGQATAGMQLTRTEARALRDVLSSWLGD